MSRTKQQGETVFVSNLGIDFILFIFDTDMNPRTLAANEVLILDALEGDTQGQGTTSVIDSHGGLVIAVFDDPNGNFGGFAFGRPTWWEGGPHGIALSTGLTASIVTSNGSLPFINGAGRIIKAGTSLGRMPWQARTA
jgi:hypothetical protein